MKYFIENTTTNKWLTIGFNTTTDPTHPGLLSFDSEEEANHHLKNIQDTFEGFDEGWKITEHIFVS